MKSIAFTSKFIFFLILFVSCNSNVSNYEKQVIEHRIKKNRSFKESNKSPLSNKEKQHFSGLNYFDYDDRFRVFADFTLFNDSTIIDLPTTKGLKKKYLLYGTASFQLNGKDFKLTVLKAMAFKSDYFFIPFKDETTTKSTYYTGRYMEVELDTLSKKLLIDFNTAYNPWCNYSDNYNCPIPVSINHLDIKIEAGEKIYHRNVSVKL